MNFYLSGNECSDKSEEDSGERGFYIHEQGFNKAISPIFNSFEDLALWMNDNGWIRVFEGFPPHFRVVNSNVADKRHGTVIRDGSA